MALKRMDNVGIVVDDLAATIDFFRELGLELEGRATIEGEWAGRVTGLGDQRVEIAMMRTPDGHGRLELSRFLMPPVVADHRNAPVNAVGYLRVMFAVDDIDGTLERLRKGGAQLVGEVVQYKDAYRLCYIRGPEGLLIGRPRTQLSAGTPTRCARIRLSGTWRPWNSKRRGYRRLGRSNVIALFHRRGRGTVPTNVPGARQSSLRRANVSQVARSVKWKKEKDLRAKTKMAERLIDV